MQKIKILHIIKSLGRGGAEMLLPETLKLHNKENFEFHYIYFLPWKDQLVGNIIEAGGIVHCFRANNNLKLVFKVKDVIEYCKDNNIDIIHCHLPWAGFLGRAVYKKTGIPVLYSEHNLQERYHKVTKFINKQTFDYQTLAFGVSNDVTSSIKRNINPSIQLKTLLNGVNTEEFVETGNNSIKIELGIPHDAIVIGVVAVFRFQKRLEEWLLVFKKIIENNRNVYGIIVGAGPLEMKIKTKCDELGLQNLVFFPGLKTNVKPYFEAIDIFMMSSSFEGLPVALLEAMSMNCAIVSTNAGGIKEVVRNEVDGLICEVDKWFNLADLCFYLINNPEKLEYYKNVARTRVVKSFSLKTMVNSLEENYINVLEKKNKIKR